MKRFYAMLLTLAMVISLAVPAAWAEEAAQPIVVLCTNDVHCAIARVTDENGAVTALGYEGVAAYKAEMEAQVGASRVTLLDAGDAIQGAPIGVLSNGAYPVDLMNATGYDFAVPGNHEFDYGMETFLSLAKRAKYSYLSCNFVDNDGNTVFAPYAIVDYGDAKVAYVGICTPETFTKSTPAYFQDENGAYIYHFCEGEGALYTAVQSAVDSARAEGADYVIALAHLGRDGVSAAWSSTAVIAQTSGIDAFVDGHSHQTYDETATNRDGEAVLLLQTGTKLGGLGKLVIDPKADTIDGELVTGYEGSDPKVRALLDSINEEYAATLKEEVASSDTLLTVLDPDTGERAVRSAETNLGDLCADAFRILLNADVGLVNGGGIRADIPSGKITYEMIINVQPFGNQLCTVEATGQQLLDALEKSVSSYPQEGGGFLQISGITYTLDPSVPSTVVLSEQGEFVRVDGARRVKDVTVGGEPLVLEKTYQVASYDYLLKNGGSGYSMFRDCPVLQDDVMLDSQALILYLSEVLGGTVGASYANPRGQSRITVLEAAETTTEAATETTPVATTEPVATEAVTEQVATEPVATEPVRAFYVVKSGDTLWGIARRQLGDGTRWAEIYRLNRAKIKNPNRIYIGQTLELPA